MAKICQKSLEMTMPVSNKSLTAQRLFKNCKNLIYYKIFEKSFKNSEFFERKLNLKTIGCINTNKNSREKSNLLFGISKT